MYIQVVGLNHRSAPLEVRERVGFTPDELPSAYAAVGRLLPHATGLVILSTCNRTEIYVAGDESLSTILGWWESVKGVDRSLFSEYCYWHQKEAAVAHLFRVASGLDSMVLGETQILGQLRAAYLLASQQEATGRLHRYFNAAFRVGKRAHSETGISRNAISMGHAVVELAKKVFGPLPGTSVLLLGAGEMGKLAAHHLKSQGTGRITIASRTLARAEALAQEIGGRAIPWEERGRGIREADIIISSTTSQTPVVTVDLCKAALKGSGDRLRFFFDLAVPRDIEVGVGQLGRGVFLYDVDDVESVVETNRERRLKEVQNVERIVLEEMSRLDEAVGAAEMGQVIRLLREKAEAIQHRELERAMKKLPSLDEQERAVVEQAVRLAVNKLLNDAMVSLREWGGREDRQVYVEAMKELFRLDDTAAPSPAKSEG